MKYILDGLLGKLYALQDTAAHLQLPTRARDKVIRRWIDRLKKVTGGIRKEGVSALYEHLAEDAPTNWVAETESQLQEMGGTELQMQLTNATVLR